MTPDNSRLTCSVTVAKDIISKQSTEWKETNIIREAGKSGRHKVDLYNLEELLKILPHNLEED